MASGVPSSRSIGIRYPVWSSYGPGVMEGVVDFMRTCEPWHLATENDSFGEMEAVRIDAGWHGDGVILFRATQEELDAWHSRGMAVVLTSTEGPDGGFPRVLPDNAMAGALAAEHLLSCAVPRFAFLARGETIYLEDEYAPGMRRYARERLGGYRRKLAEYAATPIVHYLRGRPLWKKETWREVEMETMAFLDSLPKPCGLFVVDDALAAVVLRAVRRLGLDVPKDLAVIGFGADPSYCFSAFPALSTIAWPGREIGHRAAELLWKQLHGQYSPPPGGRVELPPGPVIPRESSDTLAVADPEVRELVRQIRLRAPHDALRVSELADLSRLSLTTIKSRFAQLLGHSPKQEIQRVRLMHLRTLLADRNLSLSGISRQMGFGSVHELSRFFLGETGERPTAFRERLLGERAPRPGAGQRAVVFDMDGTLFDTEPLYWEAYRRACAVSGIALTWERYCRDFLGASNVVIESALMAECGSQGKDFSSQWRAHFRELLAASPPAPLPGVVQWLEGLCEMQVPLGLASSSDLADITLCLEAAGLSGYFRALAAGDEVAEGKPAPDVYHLACVRLGVDSSRALAIEDSERGVAAALSAGMQVIQIQQGDSAAATDVPGLVKASSLEGITWEQGLELLAGADWCVQTQPALQDASSEG